MAITARSNKALWHLYHAGSMYILICMLISRLSSLFSKLQSNTKGCKFEEEICKCNILNHHSFIILLPFGEAPSCHLSAICSRYQTTACIQDKTDWLKLA